MIKIGCRGLAFLSFLPLAGCNFAPVYHRPVGTWSRPEQIKVPLDPPPHILKELNKPRDYTADLKKLLASSNICSKRWVFEQYDSMVQTNTVQGPGGEAGVMRIKGTGTPGHERGLAMALAGNGRWCYLDPKLGAMHAVAEAARKVACTGATPVAATNCLNFGNPEKPEIMAQLSAAIDGIAEACTALGTPITGGNVSLYNETRGEGIYPTPVVGVVGILDDVTKAVPAQFQCQNDAIFFLSGRGAEIIEADGSPRIDDMRRFGSSEFARVLLNTFWGLPPQLSLDAESRLHKALAELSAASLLSSASDLSDGGLGAALAKACIEGRIGAAVQLGKDANPPVPALPWELLFAEPSSAVIITCNPTSLGELYKIAQRWGLYILEIGSVRGDSLDISVDMIGVLSVPVAKLEAVWSTSLQSQLAEEVTA